jgi:hypothetical protein
MGLIKCPDCGKMVSDRAAACPSCGCPSDAFPLPSAGIEQQPATATDSGSDTDTQIAVCIAYPMLKVIDRQDLMSANECVVKYLQNSLSVGRPITYFLPGINDTAEKVNRHEFTFPYVFVTSDFRYFLDYRKFTLTRADGRTYSRYYNQNILPSEYAPKIEVISDNEEEVIEIIDKIKVLFKELKGFYVPFPGSKNESLFFPCEIESVEKTRDIYAGGRTVFLHKTVKFKKVPWASYIDDNVNPNKNEWMRLFRGVQYAQFCLLYSAKKDEIDSQLTLYERLFLFVSKMREAFGPAQTDEYKILRNKVQAGQPFDADLVDKAFPNISLIYHELPNDIREKVPVEEVRKKIYGVLDQYKTLWEKACAKYNLPNDFEMYGQTVSLRDNDGLLYIINALDENVMRTLDDILEEVKSKITSMYLEEQMQMQVRENYYEPEPQNYGGGESFIGGVLKTAAGVALGNKISGKGKQNYFGSANCERAKTGRISSCWGCHMGELCTMYNKGKTIM